MNTDFTIDLVSAFEAALASEKKYKKYREGIYRVIQIEEGRKIVLSIKAVSMDGGMIGFGKLYQFISLEQLDRLQLLFDGYTPESYIDSVKADEDFLIGELGLNKSVDDGKKN